MLRVPILVFALAVLCGFAAAQTFDVNGQNAPPPTSNKRGKPPQNPSRETAMGWGSGIEVARQARAAQTALQRGDYRAAVNYAQRAADSAPQNPDLWFTLAYAARLAGQYSLSVDSYKRGLAMRPSSIQGLSGLAQTYARMGRSAEAQDV